VTQRSSALATAAVGITAAAPLLTAGFAPLLAGTVGYAVMLCTGALWLWVWALDRAAPPDPERRAVLIASSIIAAAITVSALFAPLPLQALLYGAEGSAMALPVWLSMVLVFALVTAMPVEARVQRSLALGALVVVMLPVLVEFTAILSRNPAVTGADPGISANVTLGLLPVVLLQARLAARWPARASWLALSVLMVWGASSTGTISATLGIVLVIVLLALVDPAVLFVPRGRARAVVRWIVALSLALAVGAVALAWVAPASTPVPLSAVVSDAVSGPTTVTRVQMWRAAWSVFVHHPVTGVGPDGLLAASQPYLTADLVRIEGHGYFGVNILVHDPHALPLLVLASGGVIGAGAALWLLGVWLWALVRRLREDRRSAPVRLAYAVGFLGLMGSIVSLPWSSRYGAVPALLAGLAVAGVATRQETAEADAVIPAAAAGIPGPAAVVLRDTRVRIGLASLATALALLGSVTAIAGDLYLAKADTAFKSEGSVAYTQAAGASRSAATLQPGRAGAVFDVLYAEGLGVVDGKVPFATYQADVQAAPALISDNGVYLALLAQHALDHALLTSDPVAARWADRVLLARAGKLVQHHPEVVLEQAHAALVLGRTAEAQRRLAEAIDLGANRRRQSLYEYYYAKATGNTAAAQRLALLIRSRAPELAPLLAP
jgi:O-antigen ligase